ncbi:MAG TPA: preprotein translocase subunit YajC [Candidatus Onthoplasma faecipullorum]|nr:preprotein translocase subunit YajC [Candidatus Onthoplasma faecipullorum]
MTEIILLVVLIVLVVALFLMSYFKKKKFNNELSLMRDELKVGDKVMTDTGVVGEVVDSYVEDEYKYFVLKTGKDKNIGYFTVHANAIYYVFGKEEANAQEKVAIKLSEPEVKEEKVDAKVEETKAEEKVADAETKPESEEKKETKPKQSKKKSTK